MNTIETIKEKFIDELYSLLSKYHANLVATLESDDEPQIISLIGPIYNHDKKVRDAIQIELYK